MGTLRTDEAAASLPVAATRPARQSQAPLLRLALWVLEKDGGIMSTGKIQNNPICSVTVIEE
jgi:hypothetical protein